MTSTGGTAPVASPAAEPTHGCARCGRPVGMGVGLCDECNPLGLRDVAASQAHGTVLIAIALAIVGMAIVAWLAMAGTGPFPVSLGAVTPVADGLSVSLTVTNEGSAGGQTSCRVFDPADQGGGPNAIVLSPRIEAGETVTFESTITQFGQTVREFTVECRTP